jgi:hypothetical protein
MDERPFLYGYRPDATVQCDHCGWAGQFRELVCQLFPRRDTVSFDCPKCSADVVSLVLPTFEEIRAAAVAGNQLAKSEPADVERQERQQASMAATQLSSAGQLPDLEVTSATLFVWDQESDADREQWTTIRTAGHGHEFWRERTYWEGYDRFNHVRDFLRQRYGSLFAGMVPSQRSLLWLGGDYVGAFNEMGDPPVATAGQAPWLPEGR